LLLPGLREILGIIFKDQIRLPLFGAQANE